MPDEFLPPVVTKLAGEIADLVAKLAEAKAAIDAFNKDVGDKSERGGRAAGARSAEALLTELRTRLKSGTLGDLTTENWTLRQDIFKAFEKAGADGGQALLMKFQKALGGDMATSVGGSVTDAFYQFGLKGGIQTAGGFMQSLKAIFASPAGIGLGAVVGASILSAIGAALHGLTLSAIGLGGLGAGIVGQMGDPEIKTAVDELTTFMKGKFQDASAPLHDDILASISDLERQTGPIFTTLKQNFIDLEPYLRPLVDSIGVFFKTASPGWSDAVKAAGPALIEVARDAQMMGNAFNIFFEQISHNKGAVEGLDMTFRILSATIVAIGWTIRGLSTAFDWLVQAADRVSKIDEKIPVMGQIIKAMGMDKYVDSVAHSYDGWGLAAGITGKNIKDLTNQVNIQKTAIQGLSDAWNTWFGVNMTVEQATLAVKTGMMDLTDSIAQNGQTFKDNTREGTANYNMLLTEISNLQAQYNAEVASGVSTKQASEEYQAQYDLLIKYASQNGLTADQIARINQEFSGLLDRLNSLDGKVVHYSVDGTGAPINPSTFWQGLASGGFVGPGGLIHAAQGLLPARSPGTLVLAGEPQTGGEVMIPQRGISQQRAAALGMAAMAPYGLGVGPAGGGGGGGRVDLHVHVMLPNGKELAAATYPDIMAQAGQRRRSFGNSGMDKPFSSSYPTGNTFGGN